jgi:hypothetical protein
VLLLVLLEALLEVLLLQRLLLLLLLLLLRLLMLRLLMLLLLLLLLLALVEPVAAAAAAWAPQPARAQMPAPMRRRQVWPQRWGLVTLSPSELLLLPPRPQLPAPAVGRGGEARRGGHRALRRPLRCWTPQV